MMRRLGLFCVLMMIAAPAYAELPEEALNKDYQACMGGDNDPERAEYCGCIRDQMRGWDLATYQALATQEAGAASGAPIPEKISDLAKTCMAKVLR